MSTPSHIQLNSDEIEARRQYISRRKKYIIRQLCNIYEYIIAMAASVIVAYPICFKINPLQGYLSVFIVWAVFYITRIVRHSLQLKLVQEAEKKSHMIVTLIKNILIICTCILSQFAFTGNKKLAIAAMLPIALAVLLPLVAYSKPTNSCYSLTLWLKLILSTIRCAVVCLVLAINNDIMKTQFIVALV